VQISTGGMVAHGPGGGGGGGRISLQGAGMLPLPTVRSGIAGEDPNGEPPWGKTNGATPANAQDTSFGGTATVLEDPSPITAGCGCHGAGFPLLLGALWLARARSRRHAQVTASLYLHPLRSHPSTPRA
jgi:hypothetical protein